MSKIYLPLFGISGVSSIGDSTGITGSFVERFDFSTANANIESRIHAVSSIASICYETTDKVNSSMLFNRLSAESKGLPSSSFEFIPVLFTEEEVNYIKLCLTKKEFVGALNIEKYGEWVTENNFDKFLITNYRAVVYDTEKNISKELPESIRDFMLYRYNTEEECTIIKKNTFVYKLTTDAVTRVQLIRHRLSFQERSRRYVSGKKVMFSFYVSKDMKDIKSTHKFIDKNNNEVEVELDIDDINTLCQRHYFDCLDKGVKAQSARRVIPQGMNTSIWVKFNNDNLQNFLALRLDSHAQKEIQELAQGIQALSYAS